MFDDFMQAKKKSFVATKLSYLLPVTAVVQEDKVASAVTGTIIQPSHLLYWCVLEQDA